MPFLLLLGWVQFLHQTRAIAAEPTTESLQAGEAGWTTNGAAVFKLNRFFYTNIFPDPARPPFNKPEFDKYRRITLVPRTNSSFHHYLPSTPQDLVWTNFIANTNGRTSLIWSVRKHSTDWPKSPPTVAWNTNSLFWGLRGFTALSPCWEGEGAPGQVPITALTRRHGYTRGHGMGPDGFNTTWRGKKVWFVGRDNSVVEVKILQSVVRTAGRDYSLHLFDRDLPETIDRLRVMEASRWATLFSNTPEGAPLPMFLTEQSGHVSAQVPAFRLDTWKGGDSGSPNLLPLPGELVFYGGRSTSGPGPEMQADLDELSVRGNLNKSDYQLDWASLP